MEIASVNLACGYYNQHTPKEILNLKELQAVIDFLQDEELIKELSSRQFKIEPPVWKFDKESVDYYDKIYRMYIDYYKTFDKGGNIW